MNSWESVSLVVLASLAGLGIGYLSYLGLPKKEKKSSSSTSTSSSPKPIRSSSSENSELRGYKKTSDGKTTSYFHRELSDQEKQLLGDMNPKKLDPIQASSSSGKAGSAWNAAGTWEEKNCEVWASSKIRETLRSIKINENGITIAVSSVENLSGEAAVTSVRGKKRYIYDFSLDAVWTAVCANDGMKYTGTLEISEITGDCDYEVCTKILLSIASAAI